MAREQFMAGRATLFASDGSQIYSDAQHAAQLKRLWDELDTAIGPAQEQADRIIKEQEAVATSLRDGDLLEFLSPAQTSLAASRAGFVHGDVQRMKPEQLATKLRAVLATGDKPSRYLWHRELCAVLAEWMDGADRGTKPPLSMEARQEIGKLLEGLADAVRGSDGKEKLARAEGLLKKARAIRKTSAMLYDEAHDFAERERRDLLRRGLYLP
jgi:hypothetical protein